MVQKVVCVGLVIVAVIAVGVLYLDSIEKTKAEEPTTTAPLEKKMDRPEVGKKTLRWAAPSITVQPEAPYPVGWASAAGRWTPTEPVLIEDEDGGLHHLSNPMVSERNVVLGGGTKGFQMVKLSEPYSWSVRCFKDGECEEFWHEFSISVEINAGQPWLKFCFP